MTLSKHLSGPPMVALRYVLIDSDHIAFIFNSRRSISCPEYTSDWYSNHVNSESLLQHGFPAPLVYLLSHTLNSHSWAYNITPPDNIQYYLNQPDIHHIWCWGSCCNWSGDQKLVIVSMLFLLYSISRWCRISLEAHNKSCSSSPSLDSGRNLMWMAIITTKTITAPKIKHIKGYNRGLKIQKEQRSLTWDLPPKFRQENIW